MARQQVQFHNSVMTHVEPVKSVTRIASSAAPSKPRYTGPVDYIWARETPPSSKVENVVTTNKQIWPKWDWRAIMALGETSRIQEKSVDVAIKETLERFRFSPTNNVVRNSWLQAGILRSIARPSTMSEDTNDDR
jgi:hypothetical protein